MNLFVITDEAKNQIEKLLAKNPGKYAVSLAVLGGGCAGFKYEWGFADTKESIGKDDHVEDWHTGRVGGDVTNSAQSLIMFATSRADTNSGAGRGFPWLW